jgi:ribosome-associated protein
MVMHERERLSFGEYDADTVARHIVDAAADKKAADIALMDVHLATTLAEFFVIATGSSDRQVGAIASGVRDRMDEDDIQLLGEEGRPSDGWVLLDYGQVIVHIFGVEQRAYYDLEKHWKDAPTLLRIQ